MNYIRQPNISCVWITCILIGHALGPLSPPALAIPAFARKHNVKCYSCHTIPPVLNKTGYIFKRLGYRLPPDDMERGGRIPRTIDLEKNTRWNIGNAVALTAQVSYNLEQTRGEERSSSSSFSFDKALVLTGGTVPQTNFFYFGEVKFKTDKTQFEQGIVGYCGGRANSSYFVKAGKMFLQEGEGTRSLFVYSLFPEESPALLRSGPTRFSLDQAPAAIGAGYTWASSYYKNVIAISGKVTNGVDAEGEPRTADPHHNSKDAWVDVDWWFGPDGGISAMAYYGRKDQIQSGGGVDEFTFRPHIRRYGLFGNYLFFNKLDVQGGYLRSQDDWRIRPDGPLQNIRTNAYRSEIDFYPVRGFVLMGRYERLQLRSGLGVRQNAESWMTGASKALTATGNVVLRASYGLDHNPGWESVALTNRRFMLDLRVMW